MCTGARCSLSIVSNGCPSPRPSYSLITPVLFSELTATSSLLTPSTREKEATHIASSPCASPRRCTQQHVPGVKPSLIIFIISVPAFRQHATNKDERARERTKVDDIEHLCAPVLRDAREELPVRARGDGDDGREVRAVVLHELDPLFLLLPELEVPVDGSRY